MLAGRLAHWANAFLKRTVGIKVEKHCPGLSAELRLQRMLVAQCIDAVIDVGANTGQFAQELRRAAFAGLIVSFEPLSEAHSWLSKNSVGDERWVIAPRVALGSEQATATIYVAGNSASSSILPMLELHKQAAPGSAPVSAELVPLQLLDDYLGSLFARDQRIFLKIDTQGYEKQVLSGAKQTLDSVRALQVELSLVPLYEGQALLPEMLLEISRLGFELHSLEPVFFDRESGRAFQYDGLFVRTA